MISMHKKDFCVNNGPNSLDFQYIYIYIYISPVLYIKFQKITKI
jgi:hypothetical protein